MHVQRPARNVLRVCYATASGAGRGVSRRADGEQLGLALGRETARDEARAHRRGELARAHGAQPLPGRARGLRERAQPQPRGAGASVRERVEGAVLGRVGEPQRQLVERLDALRRAAARRSPRRASRRRPSRSRQAASRSRERRRSAADVEDPRRAAARRARPRSARGRARRSSCTGASGEPGASSRAAAGDALDPPGEAVRRIVRPGHDPRAQDQRAARGGALGLLLARDLERAVELGARRRRPRCAGTACRALDSSSGGSPRACRPTPSR